MLVNTRFDQNHRDHESMLVDEINLAVAVEFVARSKVEETWKKGEPVSQQAST
jgi:hypothetical protein